MALALFGVFNVSGHTIPTYPIQPFASDAQGGLSTNKLGDSIASNYTITQTLYGERSALPWIFSAPGFTVDADSGGPYSPPILKGTVWTSIDALCNGVTDYMYKLPCNSSLPLDWEEATADKTKLNLETPDASFLLNIMPPWPWLARHKVVIDHLCLGGTTSTATASVLNTVYAQVPFSPGGAAFVAQTKLGGAPDNPPSTVCLDTPQSSTSVTNLYNNPAKANANNGGATGVDGRGLDDNSGLYARWTILQSQGSSSLARSGDLRKSYASPPSIGSDIGYVERIIDLQCFWIDDDGGAPDGGDGIISETESWNDPDFLAMGGVATCDTDRDCLIDSACAQPLRTAYVDGDDEPNVAVCGASPYSGYPSSLTPPLNTSADTDCDTLVDGIEVAYGSLPADLDDDSDGDGATDFEEMFQFTNPIGTGSTDTDADGYLDKPATVYGDNDDTSMDNCPSVYNPSQLNSDGARRPNGIKISGDYASNPNQDKLGDACDDDDDNDGATDTYEPDTTGGKVASLPLVADTDGDTVVDGVEWHVNTDPTDITSYPTWDATLQLYYRGCHINTAKDTEHAYTDWDAEYDAVNDDVEYDPDGDNSNCPGDGDSDSGSGGLHANMIELLDQYEAMGYNTGITNQDTDGDGCHDWVEIHDLNGDRTVDSGDQGAMNRRAAGKILSDCDGGTYPGPNPSSCVSDRVFDINKDGYIDSGDQGSMNKNTCQKKLWGGCESITGMCDPED